MNNLCLSNILRFGMENNIKRPLRNPPILIDIKRAKKLTKDY